MTNVLRESRPVARKPHRCDLCGAVIPAGQKYSRQTNIFDGRLYDWLTCELCLPVFSAVFAWCSDYAYAHDEGVGTDDADEWAREHSTDPLAIAYLARREAAWARYRATKAGVA